MRSQALLSAVASIAGLAGAKGAHAAENEALHTSPQALSPIAVGVSPLAALVGRYSVDVTAVIAPHHGALVTPFVWAPMARLYRPYLSRFSTAVGAEVGYRFFADPNGPFGAFAGPSVSVAWVQDAVLLETLTSGVRVEGLLDVGYALRLGGRAVVSLGGGVVVLSGGAADPPRSLGDRLRALASLALTFDG